MGPLLAHTNDPTKTSPASHGPSHSVVAGTRVLGTAWLLLFFINNHRLYFGEGTDRTSNLINGFAELVVYSFAVLLIAVDRRHTRVDGEGVPVHEPVRLWLYVLPVWCLASLAWGSPDAQLVIRTGEMGITALLTNVTINRALRSPAFIEELLGFLFRWFTFAVVGLTFLGFTVGPLYARLPPFESRYTWPAAHPGVAGAFLTPALVIMLFAPRRVIPFHPLLRAGALALMGLALVQNHSRTAVAAFLLVALVGVWLVGRTRPALRIFVPPYLFGAALVGLLLTFSSVVDYVLRGGSTGQLLTLNSRTKVWAELPDKLTWFGRWLIGLGYGASRTAFIEDFAFAGNSHNTVVALIVGTGLVGLVIAVVYLGIATAGAVLTITRRNSVIGSLTLLILLSFIIQGSTADAFSDPNLGLAWLYLCMGLWCIERERRARGGPHSPRPEPPVRN